MSELRSLHRIATNIAITELEWLSGDDGDGETHRPPVASTDPPSPSPTPAKRPGGPVERKDPPQKKCAGRRGERH